MSPTTYTERRRRLAELVDTGLIVLPGNQEAPMNYAGNPYPFRQDSSFRYFTGLTRPGLLLTIDAETGESILYGDDATLDDAIWMGEQPSMAELGERAGLNVGGSWQNALDTVCYAEVVHYLPLYREERRRILRRCVNHSSQPSEELIRAVVKLRSVKSAEEIAELDRADIDHEP